MVMRVVHVDGAVNMGTYQNPEERHTQSHACVSVLSMTCEPRAVPRDIASRVPLQASILEALSSNYVRKTTVLISIP